jgi:hypothetical protein
LERGGLVYPEPRRAVAAAQSLAMAALTLAHAINLPEIIALAPLQGLINALMCPRASRSWCKWSKIGMT